MIKYTKEELNKILGLMQGPLTVFKAPTGIGKTGIEAILKEELNKIKE